MLSPGRNGRDALSSKPQYRLDATTWRLTGRLWRDWMRPYLGRICLGAGLMAVVAACAGAYPLLIEVAVDKMTARERDFLWLLPPVIIVIALIKGSASYGQSVITQSLALRVIANLQDAMFAHLMRADLALFQETATGRLVSRFTNDVNMLRDALSKALTGMVRDLLTVAMLVGAMFYLDPLLALATVLIFPLSAWPIVRIGRRLRRVSAHTQEEMGQLTALLNEAFGGVRLIKAYRMEGYQRRRAASVIDNVRRLVAKAVRGRARMYPILETLGGIAVATVLAFGAVQIVYRDGSLGAFTGFLTALLMAYQPMRSLGNLNASLQQGLAAAARIFDLLDQAPEIVDPPHAAPIAVGAGAIRFEDVTFAYEHGKPALEHVSLDVPAGKTVALVGPSGAGKSTVLNLIPRFFDANEGRVTIDDQDVAEVTVASLRDQIALVSQSVTLFDDTVRANLAFGRPGAEDEAIVAAAEAADCDAFIRALPQGYDTVVGEHGVKLSGGQRQRIAIARAMLKDVPILLLDEATSALDTESERQVQAALERLRGGRTTLVIAHRLSTVASADLIHVLDRGRVVERGTHAELRAQGGLYARLCRLQFHDTAVPSADEAAETRNEIPAPGRRARA